MTVGRTRNFGVLLRQHRRAAGFTQEALAEAAGLSARGIQDLERGVSQSPRSVTIDLLAAALDLAEHDRAALALTADGPSRVLNGQVHPALFASGLVPLVGRLSELAILDQFLQREGGTAIPVPLLLLAGEPGIGKTRLLQAAAQRAVARGWTVLVAGCHRRGGQEPYSPVIDALAAHLHAQPSARLTTMIEGCAWLVRLLPELAAHLEPLPVGGFRPEQERRLLFAAVARVLSNAAGNAGMLLILDDLQWAGLDALDLLATLVRNPTLPLRVLGGYRDTEVRPDDPLGLFLGELAQAGLVRQQALGPLSEEDAATLLDDLLVGAAEANSALTTRVLQRAGGTPFFLVSYAQALAAGSRETVPWDLTQGVRQRVSLLPASSREVLGAAAIAGRHVSRSLLLAVVSQSEDETLTGLDEACRARLLLEKGDQAYAFAHDVIREVVEAEISAARRAVLHRRLAEALEHGVAPAPPELLAYHYARSDLEVKAVTYLELAGDQACLQGAHTAAERHYRDLLDRLDLPGRADDARRVREKLANVLYGSGRYDGALAMLESAADDFAFAGDWVGMARVTARIGWAHWRRGTADDGIARITRLQELLNRHLEQPPSGLYAALGQRLFGTGQYSRSLAATEQAVERARANGEDRAGALAEAQLMHILQTAGRVEDALRVSQAMFPAIEGVGDLDALRLAHSGLAYIRVLRGELDTARRHLDRARAICEQIGDPVSLSFPLTLGARVDSIDGNWRRAHDQLKRALDLSRQVERSWYAPCPPIFLARLLLAEGVREAAVVASSQALALAERSGDLQAVRWAAPTMAELDIQEGRPAAAVARLTPLLDQAGLEECDVTALLPVLAAALLDLGQVDEASKLVAQALARARREGLRIFLVEALQVQAQVALRQEQWAEVECSLEEGMAVARAIPYPYAEAQILRLDSQRHAALGDRTAGGGADYHSTFGSRHGRRVRGGCPCRAGPRVDGGGCRSRGARKRSLRRERFHYKGPVAGWNASAHSPVAPSRSSRVASAWPAWRAVSLIKWRRTQRRSRPSPNLHGSASDGSDLTVASVAAALSRYAATAAPTVSAGPGLNSSSLLLTFSPHMPPSIHRHSTCVRWLTIPRSEINRPLGVHLASASPTPSTFRKTAPRR